MNAKLIDGIKIAANIRKKIATIVAERRYKGLRIPGLAVILVGNNPASKTYVKYKQQDCKEVGFISRSYDLETKISEREILNLIDYLNNDPSIDGILIQLPLPDHLNTSLLLDHINPYKDVDGLHPYNIGRLAQRIPMFRPCTPKGIMILLNSTGVNMYGMDTLVIGASNIVGRPMALELLLQGCTVTITHRFTNNLAEYVYRSDIVIVAAGQTGLLKGDWVKPNAIIIDVGINRQKDGKLKGDVEYESAYKRASWITPVPGGVGPMTRACLLDNTLQATDLHEKK